MNRRATARDDEQVRGAENEQRRNRQSVSEHREQEQSVNMDRQAAAHNDEQVREAEMSNDAIGGWFLNIGNRTNLSTWIDEPLHAKMNK